MERARRGPGILHFIFPDGPDGFWRRNKKVIEAKQNVVIKKLTCKGTFRQVIICLMTRTYTLPPLHTVNVYTVYLGKGGELNQREG